MHGSREPRGRVPPWGAPQKKATGVATQRKVTFAKNAPATKAQHQAKKATGIATQRKVTFAKNAPATKEHGQAKANATQKLTTSKDEEQYTQESTPRVGTAAESPYTKMVSASCHPRALADPKETSPGGNAVTIVPCTVRYQHFAASQDRSPVAEPARPEPRDKPEHPPPHSNVPAASKRETETAGSTYWPFGRPGCGAPSRDYRIPEQQQEQATHGIDLPCAPPLTRISNESSDVPRLPTIPEQASRLPHFHSRVSQPHRRRKEEDPYRMELRRQADERARLKEARQHQQEILDRQEDERVSKELAQMRLEYDAAESKKKRPPMVSSKNRALAEIELLKNRTGINAECQTIPRTPAARDRAARAQGAGSRSTVPSLPPVPEARQPRPKPKPSRIPVLVRLPPIAGAPPGAGQHLVSARQRGRAANPAARPGKSLLKKPQRVAPTLAHWESTPELPSSVLYVDVPLSNVETCKGSLDHHQDQLDDAARTDRPDSQTNAVMDVLAKMKQAINNETNQVERSLERDLKSAERYFRRDRKKLLGL